VLEDAFAFNTKFDQVASERADFTNVPLRGRCAQKALRQRHRHQSRTARVTRDTLDCP